MSMPEIDWTKAPPEATHAKWHVCGCVTYWKGEPHKVGSTRLKTDYSPHTSIVHHPDLSRVFERPVDASSVPNPTAEPLKIEAGKRYVMRNKGVTTEMRGDASINADYPFYAPGTKVDGRSPIWTEEGRYHVGEPNSPYDIVAEYTGEDLSGSTESRRAQEHGSPSPFESEPRQVDMQAVDSGSSAPPAQTPLPTVPYVREPGYIYIETPEDKAKYAPKFRTDNYWSLEWKQWGGVGLDQDFDPDYYYRRRDPSYQPTTRKEGEKTSEPTQQVTLSTTTMEPASVEEHPTAHSTTQPTSAPSNAPQPSNPTAGASGTPRELWTSSWMGCPSKVFLTNCPELHEYCRSMGNLHAVRYIEAEPILAQLAATTAERDELMQFKRIVTDAAQKGLADEPQGNPGLGSNEWSNLLARKIAWGRDAAIRLGIVTAERDAALAKVQEITEEHKDDMDTNAMLQSSIKDRDLQLEALANEINRLRAKIREAKEIL